MSSPASPPAGQATGKRTPSPAGSSSARPASPSSNASTRPASPDARTSSPARSSLRSRMGTMMRRTSTGLTSLGKPSALRRSESKSSVKADTPLGTPMSIEGLPSPVAESPAREAAALISVASPPVGPSPLSDATAPAQGTATAGPASPSAPISIADQFTSSSQVFEKPFSASPDSHHSVIASIISEQFASGREARSSFASAAQPSENIPSIPVSATASNRASTSSQPSSQYDHAASGVIQTSTIEKTDSYFALTKDRSVQPTWAPNDPAGAKVIQDTTSPQPNVTPPHTSDAQVMTTNDGVSLSSKHSISTFAGGSSIRHDSQAQPSRYGGLSSKASKSSMSTSYGQVVVAPHGRQISIMTDSTAEDESRRGRSPGQSFSNVPLESEESQGAPGRPSVLSPIESIDTPLPDQGPAVYPLPPPGEVISSRSAPYVPSSYGFGNVSIGGNATSILHATEHCHYCTVLPKRLSTNVNLLSLSMRRNRHYCLHVQLRVPWSFWDGQSICFPTDPPTS
ncbi:uncharacterized protein LAESUDRAFT_178279 [Laetiporus sulphureus 93-53]|uniref:Uncharacterized protein n=1 Tax=Laetiporus sulphureus 93-53 TaxID=1314785 RepID=A0A165E8C5_9APHY|nr:uncharacterized protein LAESUDRAFT_178279 [Laetiporus sulphureus 93-53]KZT06447.1 hypothetical protein LAESUDRAFT_178279 [Laetiporus sulphureus 93-53]